MKRNLVILSAIVFIATAVYNSEARAQSPRVRLNMDTSVFTFNRTAVERKGDTDYYNSFGLGESVGFDPGTGNVPGFGFGIGFLPIENLTIGGTFGIAGGQIQGRQLGLDESIFEHEYTHNVFSYRVLPFVEYKFNLGMAQPYLMVALGYRGGTQWNSDNDDLTMTNHLFAYGGGGGVHLFLTDSVAIDTGIEAMGGVGKSIVNYEGDETSHSIKSDLRDFNASLKLGLSGWF